MSFLTLNHIQIFERRSEYNKIGVPTDLHKIPFYWRDALKDLIERGLLLEEGPIQHVLESESSITVYKFTDEAISLYQQATQPNGNLLCDSEPSPSSTSFSSLSSI